MKGERDKKGWERRRRTRNGASEMRRESEEKGGERRRGTRTGASGMQAKM